MKRFLSLLLLAAVSVGAFAATDNEITAMSFNIRYPNKADSLNYWPNRKDYASGLIRFHKVEIAGLQEATKPQIDDLLERLPGFAFIGVGREDGKQGGEYSPILYDKEKFTLLDGGTFWLSDSPETAGSKGWDGACRRVATWGVFIQKSTGRKFFFMNTHLDHVGKIARREGARLLRERMEKLSKGLPAILTGDFNSEPESEPIQILLNDSNPYRIRWSRAESPFVYGPYATWHEFGKIPHERRDMIDYLFVAGDVEVSEYGVVSEHDGALYPSDHFPVLVRLSINKK